MCKNVSRKHSSLFCNCTSEKEKNIYNADSLSFFIKLNSVINKSSIYSSVCLCIFLFVFVSVLLSFCPSVHLSICPSVCLAIWLFVSVCLFVCLARCLPLSVCPLFRPSVRLSVHLFSFTGHPSVHLSSSLCLTLFENNSYAFLPPKPAKQAFLFNQKSYNIFFFFSVNKSTRGNFLLQLRHQPDHPLEKNPQWGNSLQRMRPVPQVARGKSYSIYSGNTN
jgi:hypothetical protein